MSRPVGAYGFKPSVEHNLQKLFESAHLIAAKDALNFAKVVFSKKGILANPTTLKCDLKELVLQACGGRANQTACQCAVGQKRKKLAAPIRAIVGLEDGAGLL